MSSFFPAPLPHYALPQAQTIRWDVVDGGGATSIDLDTIKNFLNIPLEDNAFDPEKSMFSVMAQEAVEKWCEISILTTTWIGYAPQFFDQMRVNRRPFGDVTKIEYVDTSSGVITTLDPSYYLFAKSAQRCGTIMLGQNMQWPKTAIRPDAVRITVTAGWAKPDIPATITNAILQTISALDHARADDGGASQGPRTNYALKHMQAPTIIPIAAQAMLSPYRLVKFGAA